MSTSPAARTADDLRAARAAWATGLGAVLLGPVALRLASAPTEPLWSQLAVVTGLLALSALVATVILPCRVRSLTTAFGIEAVLGMHRVLGTATAVLVLLHLACVVAADPVAIALLDLRTAGPAARAAVGATAALLALVALAVLRRRLGGSYETWRWVHLGLACVALAGAGLHVWWLGQLVADPRMRAVLAALAVGVLGVLGHRWGWRPMLDPASEFTVREVRPETTTTTTLVLETGRGRHSGSRWDFAPGQFAWLRLRRSAAAEEHPFTIASSAEDGRHVEFTVRHRGDFTTELRSLPPGAPVWVDGPHGAFTPASRSPAGVVMIAGGVGVTPMMSILRTAADRGDPRPHRLVCIAAERDELLFRTELALLRERLDLDVTEVLRRPSAGWTGHTGGIGVDLLAAVLDGARHGPDHGRWDYFLCGPPGLVADTLDALDALEVPADRIHTEQFDLV